MVINLKTIRSAFYFLGNVALTKSSGATQVDLLSCEDSTLLGIACAIKNSELQSDVDAISIGAFIKDIKIKTMFNKVFNISEKLVETAVVVEEVITEVISPAVEEVITTEEQEETEYFDSLKELLNGNVKVVVENLSNAALSDEDKIALLDFEQQDKNRKAVITAISEL